MEKIGSDLFSTYYSVKCSLSTVASTNLQLPFRTAQLHECIFVHYPMYNGAKHFVFLAPFRILGTILYSQSVSYSWLSSVFLAVFRGLHCEIGLFLASALHPTPRRNNGIVNTAAFGTGAEKEGK